MDTTDLGFLQVPLVLAGLILAYYYVFQWGLLRYILPFNIFS